MKIALNKTAHSFSFVMDLGENEAWKNSPLSLFMKYLFKAIQYKSKELYLETREVFKQSLERDAEFGKLLDKIG